MKQKLDFIFKNKGKLCAFAEKAVKNKTKIGKLVKDTEETKKLLHYFAIGHQFKNIDVKSAFDYQLNERESDFEPTRYLSLQLSSFLKNDFSSTLEIYIKNIRNLNSHYLHIFDKIDLSNSPLKLFIKEAFELVFIHVFMKEKNLNYEKAAKNKKRLVTYLCNQFYPDNEYLDEVRSFFLSLSWDKALEYLLFISIDENYEWKDNTDYTLLTIKKGIYPSFWSMLFLVCMFLYKHEANLIISKIQGLKRTEKNFQPKRKLFTFFSKKMSSQDLDSESQHLVKFEDIIQYLGKYPTCWNAFIQGPEQDKEFTIQLKKGILLEEFKRQFPTPYKGFKATSFYQYVAQSLLSGEQLDYFQIPIKDKLNKKSFLFYFNNSPEQQNLIQKNKTRLKRLDRNSKKYRDIKCTIKKLKNEENKNQVKVKNKLETASIWQEYGRNQDRFMLIAVRYLAEINYFGVDTQFRVYAYRTVEEQMEQLESKKESLSKKEYDKLKYHEGRLVAFKTYQKHLETYPQWNTPFVVQNNAIQIKKKISNKERIINIQRQLMPYFLQDALYFSTDKKMYRYDLLIDYSNQYIFDRESGLELLQKESITREEKTELSLLFPKRLLHQYCPAIHPETKQLNAFEKILEQAQQDNLRYNSLLLQAQEKGEEQEFTKRNKGKQYKLRFIRKAWHLMYFRDAYMQNKRDAKGHHKSLHISKEEFQDFTRWMYAFDEVEQYKEHLIRLFKSKNFLRNHEFQHLILFSKSLDQLFVKTRVEFEKWLKTNSPDKVQQRSLENYLPILNDNMWFINITHFRKFLMSDRCKAKHFKGKNGKINFSALNNSNNLINSYYEKESYLNQNKKLFNELKTAKLEDSLLYEIAFHYLNVKGSYKLSHRQVNQILRSEVRIMVNSIKNENLLYTIKAPFKKLLDLDKKISLYKNTSRGYNLEKLFYYIHNNKNDSDIRPIYKSLKDSKSIRIDEVHQVNSHLVRKAVVFNEVAMALERYYIIKNKYALVEKGYSGGKDIKELENFNFSNSKSFLYYRSYAMHFDIPEFDFFTILKELERQFIELELVLDKIQEWDDLPPFSKKLFFIYMSKLHNSLFRKERVSKNKKKNVEYSQEVFKKNYVDKIILGKINGV
ncbi:MAG: hypothetical protein GX963_12450 [Bacteroidales bacterium]|nr:hypothetical protein [Bacteroidales bacterium]